MSARRNWTLAIIGLLGGNLISMGIIAFIAHRDQAQIIPAYDVQAANYDREIDEAERSRAIGWSASAALLAGVVEVRVVDANGVALGDARVRVRGYPLAHAVDRIDIELLALGGGLYQAPLRAAGRYDLTIHVDRAGVQFSQRAAVETQ